MVANQDLFLSNQEVEMGLESFIITPSDKVAKARSPFLQFETQVA